MIVMTSLYFLANMGKQMLHACLHWFWQILVSVYFYDFYTHITKKLYNSFALEPQTLNCSEERLDLENI